MTGCRSNYNVPQMNVLHFIFIILNNSMKHQPMLIIFGIQHPKKIDTREI